MLVIQEAHPQNFGDTRFNTDTPGFEKNWWLDDTASGICPGFSFFKDGEEVARAEVKPDQVEGSYIGLKTPRSVLHIPFFEVRRSRHREGIGQEAIALLVQVYPDEDMAAFSNTEESHRFWKGIGWTRFPRVDGDTAPRPLFIHWAGERAQ